MIASSGQVLVELPEEPLRVDRVGVLHGAVLHQPPPVRDLLLDLLAPATVGLVLRRAGSAPRASPSRRRSGRAPSGSGCSASGRRCRSARRAPCRARAGTPSTGTTSRPSSSVSHSFISVQLGFVPSRPIEPVQYGSVSSSTVRPSSAFATPAPSFSAICITSSCRAERALADEHRDLLAGVQDLGRLPQVGSAAGRRAARDQPGEEWIVPCLCGGSGDGRLLGEVVRDDHAGDGALVERDPVRRGRRGGGSAPRRSPSRRTRARRP